MRIKACTSTPFYLDAHAFAVMCTNVESLTAVN